MGMVVLIESQVNYITTIEFKYKKKIQKLFKKFSLDNSFRPQGLH